MFFIRVYFQENICQNKENNKNITCRFKKFLRKSYSIYYFYNFKILSVDFAIRMLTDEQTNRETDRQTDDTLKTLDS